MTTQSIKLQSDVPVPERTRLPSLPLEEMKAGQSFAIACKNDREIQALRQRVCRYQNKYQDTQFSVRRDTEDESKMRVFRVE